MGISEGWLSEPAPLPQRIPDAVSLTPRYAISEQHGDGARKVGIIDDRKASGVDAVTSTHDTAVPDSLGVFLAIISYYWLVAPGRGLRAASSDFPHAYKTIGIPCDAGKFSSVLPGPPTGPLLVAQIRTNPFGRTRAPSNWGWVAKLLQWALLTCFGIHLPIYLDDCFLVEAGATVESAYQCANAFIALCGVKLGKFSHRHLLPA